MGALALTGALLLLAGLSAWFVASVVTAPVGRITSAVRDFAEGGGTAHLPAERKASSACSRAKESAQGTCTSGSRWEGSEMASHNGNGANAPVVMVDDNDSDIVLARFCYEDAGMPNPFVAMHSGSELLAYLDAVVTDSAAMPAIVLLDLNMPGMSGFEVLARTRARLEFRRTPFIMMLTHSEYAEDATRARELGADGFRTKPCRVKEYVEFFASLRNDH